MSKVGYKKNDVVKVISGKDKGKTGKILKVMPEKNSAIVEKVNFLKEFIRRDQSRNIQGGVMEKEAPIHVSNRAIVEKVNFIKEFIRRDQSRNIQGGVMEKEAPIHVSNLMLYCSECGRGVRIKNKKLEDGSTIRVCSKCDSTIE